MTVGLSAFAIHLLSYAGLVWQSHADRYDDHVLAHSFAMAIIVREALA